MSLFFKIIKSFLKGLFTNDSEKFFLEEAQKEPKKPAKLTEKASIKIDEPEILRKFELQHDLIPESVLILYGSDDFLKERCKSLPANFLNGSHYTEEGMFRRLLGWRKMNEENMRNIGSFYRGNDFEIMDLNVEEKKAEEETLKQIQAFIERVRIILIFVLLEFISILLFLHISLLSYLVYFHVLIK